MSAGLLVRDAADARPPGVQRARCQSRTALLSGEGLPACRGPALALVHLYRCRGWNTVDEKFEQAGIKHEGMSEFLSPTSKGKLATTF